MIKQRANGLSQVKYNLYTHLRPLDFLVQDDVTRVLPVSQSGRDSKSHGAFVPLILAVLHKTLPEVPETDTCIAVKPDQMLLCDQGDHLHLWIVRCQASHVFPEHRLAKTSPSVRQIHHDTVDAEMIPSRFMPGHGLLCQMIFGGQGGIDEPNDFSFLLP